MYFNGERLFFCLFLVIMVDSSSGNKMKKKPIALNPIISHFLTHRHSVERLLFLAIYVCVSEHSVFGFFVAVFVYGEDEGLQEFRGVVTLLIFFFLSMFDICIIKFKFMYRVFKKSAFKWIFLFVDFVLFRCYFIYFLHCFLILHLSRGSSLYNFFIFLR